MNESYNIIPSDVWLIILQYNRICPVNRESLHAYNTLNQYYDLKLNNIYGINIATLISNGLSIDKFRLILYQITYNRNVNLIYRIYEHIRSISSIEHSSICISILQCLIDNKYHELGSIIYKDIDKRIDINTLDNPYPLLRYSNISQFIHILHHIGNRNTYKCIPYLNDEQIEFIYSNGIYSIDNIVQLNTLDILNISNMILYLRKSTYTSIYIDIKNNEDPYISIYRLYDRDIGSIGSLLDNSLSIEMYKYISPQFEWDYLYIKYNIEKEYKLHNLYHLYTLLMNKKLSVTVNDTNVQFKYVDDSNIYLYNINSHVVELLNNL